MEDVAPQPPDETRYGQIGPYRLLDILGEGGMGTVYLAEQIEPVHRRVALKLIKPGMDSRQVLARFEVERQTLAMMEHSAIARVYDAGITESGHPYFVMELIRGEPISAFCDHHQLDIPARLDLFLRVCDGVQHAHQKGVIHRDLKPSNILVAMEGNVPMPKIIDFGLARATDDRSLRATLYTERGQILGTPEYMSPEQADLNNRDIDTRTDVYSLGVVLYELLVGQLPFPPEVLRQAGLLEMMRKIREDEPPRPSSRLALDRESATEIVRRRKTEVRALRRRLRDDLDWVVLCALEKLPSRRYSTAAALADDVRRHIACEPLAAGPPSATYRLRKLVRRHRLPLAVGALLLITMAGGLAAFAVENRRALIQETLARNKADEATKATERAENALADLRQTNQQLTEAQRRSEGLRLATIATTLVDTDPTQALLVAIAAAEMYPSQQASGALVRTLDACHEERILGHPTNVALAKFSADGRRVVTIDDDTLRIWDLAGRAAPVEWSGDHRVRDVVIGAGDRVVLRHVDGRADIRDLSGRVLAVAGSRQAPVEHVAALPKDAGFLVVYRLGPIELRDPGGQVLVTCRHELPLRPECTPVVDPAGHRIAAVDARGRLLVWDSGSGEMVCSVDNVATDRPSLLAFDGGGRRLLAADRGGPGVRLVDLQSRDMRSFAGKAKAAWFVVDQAWLLDDTSEDGRSVAIVGEAGKPLLTDVDGDTEVAGGRILCQRRAHRTAEVVDLATGRVLLQVPGAQIGDETHLSPDGRRVLTRSGGEVRVFAVDRPGATRRLPCEWYSGALDPTGHWFASATKTGVEVRSLDGDMLWKVSDETAAHLRWSSDGKHLAALERGTRRLRVWHLGDRREVLVRDLPRVLYSTFGLDANLVSVMARDGRVLAYSLADGAEHVTDFGRPLARRAFFAADGREITTVDGLGVARRWSLPAGTLLEENALAPDEAPVLESWSLSPNGRWLVLGGRARIDVATRERIDLSDEGWWQRCLALDNGQVLEVDGDFPDIRVDIKTPGTESRTFVDDLLPSAAGERQEVRYSRGTSLAGARAISGPGALHAIWLGRGVLAVTRDGETIARVRALDSRVECADFHPGGERLATGHADGSVTVWAIPAAATAPRGTAAALESVLRFTASSAPLSCCRFGSGGTRLLIADRQGRVAVLEATTGKLDREWQGHDAAILGLDVIETDPAMVATSGADGLVRVWGLPDGRPIARLSGHRGMLRDAWISHDRSLALARWQDTPGVRKDVLDLQRGTRSGTFDGPLPRVASADGTVLAHENGFPSPSAIAITEDVAYADWLADQESVRMEGLWRIANGAAAFLPGRIDGVSPDGRWLATITVNNSVAVTPVDARTPEQTRVFFAAEEPYNPVFSADAGLLAFRAGSTVYLVDLTHDRVSLVLRDSVRGEIAGLAITPDKLVTGLADGKDGLFWVPLDLLGDARARAPRSLRARERLDLECECSHAERIADLVAAEVHDPHFEARIRARVGLSRADADEAVSVARVKWLASASAPESLLFSLEGVRPPREPETLLSLARQLAATRGSDPSVQLAMALAEYHNQHRSEAAQRFDDLLRTQEPGTRARNTSLVFRSLLYHEAREPQRADGLLLEYSLKNTVRWGDDADDALQTAFGPRSKWGGAQRPVYDEGIRLLEQHIWELGSVDAAKAKIAQLEPSPVQQAALFVAGPAYEPNGWELDAAVWPVVSLPAGIELDEMQRALSRVESGRSPWPEDKTPNIDQLVRLARWAALCEPRSRAIRRTWGTACYRAGQLDLALALFQWGFEPEIDEWDYLERERSMTAMLANLQRESAHEALLAMILHRQGHADAARAAAKRVHEKSGIDLTGLTREMDLVLASPPR